MTKTKTRCAHKDCIRPGRDKIRITNARNTLGKDHLCCGYCCPKTVRR